MLLMSGFLCHKCLPDNCRDGGIYPTSKGTCSNIIGKGYKCTCDEGSYGDHCQHREADRPKNTSPPPPPPPPPVVASGGVFDVAPDWIAYLFVLALAATVHNAVMFM